MHRGWLMFMFLYIVLHCFILHFALVFLSRLLFFCLPVSILISGRRTGTLPLSSPFSPIFVPVPVSKALSVIHFHTVVVPLLSLHLPVHFRLAWAFWRLASISHYHNKNGRNHTWLSCLVLCCYSDICLTSRRHVVTPMLCNMIYINGF